ncbi:hypothetical protein [Candidatus Villigracilis proximus]|uniref:hypothetical protein n=1 Tax=Candidatus Villigracilis proximus TaxID=3140683 RepID=UPI0031E78881
MSRLFPQIGNGLLISVGISHGDGEERATFLAEKLPACAASLKMNKARPISQFSM